MSHRTRLLDTCIHVVRRRRRRVSARRVLPAWMSSRGGVFVRACMDTTIATLVYVHCTRTLSTFDVDTSACQRSSSRLIAVPGITTTALM